MLDEDAQRMYLRTTKPLKKEEDVFLIDHAWTFKHRTAYKDLQTHEKLVERMDNILKYASKRDLPTENPYAKKRPTLEEALKKYEESTEPVLAYDLDSYGIEELKGFNFKPEVEEISLWDN